MSTIDLINKLRDGDTLGAEKAFNSAMANKVTDALDAKKIEVASTLFSDSVEAEVVETEEEVVETEEVVEAEEE